jgi:hypothetical protein
MHALLVFLYIISCYFGVEKQSQILACFFLYYSLILKMRSVSFFKNHKAAVLTQKMHTGSCLLTCKIIPKATCDN